MNLKIGELVEYVEVLKAAQRRRVEKLRKTIEELVDLKKEQDEYIDGQQQQIDNLNQQLKLESARVESCRKCFKELEDAWCRRDENIVNWFVASALGKDRAEGLLKFLREKI